MKLYLNDDLRCSGLMQAKRSEMVYLLNCYYPIKELAAFYAPVYRYSHSFQYFVMQNYQKAKDVETFAQLGATAYPPSPYLQGYVRRARLSMELKRKCQDIHNDLIIQSFPYPRFATSMALSRFPTSRTSAGLISANLPALSVL